MDQGPLLTTGQLRKLLGVSHGAVIKWQRQGLITPALTTPGGHHRWIEADVRAELAALRRADDE